MTTEDAPLTETQRLLTAWIDGELDATETQAFERLLQTDPALAEEAARQRELVDLTAALPRLQPSDLEARRFWQRFYNRGEWRLGWTLLLAGAALLLGFGVYELLTGDLHWAVKAGSIAVLLGGGILLWNTLRLRLRTSRFDRYRGVLH